MEARSLPFRGLHGAVAILTLMVSAVSAVEPARAEVRLSAYSGIGDTRDSDVRLDRGGTDLTFRDVSWDHESFEAPIYYGLRLTYWPDRAPNWGVGIDFTHPKMIADTGQVVSVTGTRAGSPVAGPEPLGNTISSLQFSHGHNLLMLNGSYRWLPGEWMEPYVGLGLGVAIPRIEVVTDGVTTDEYQVAGPAAQGLAGVSFTVYGPLSLFAEYKLSYADMEAGLDGGGTLRVEPWTNHFILGISLDLF